MQGIFNLFSVISSFAEGFLVLYVTGRMCGEKYGKKKYFILVTLFSAVYAFAVTVTQMSSELFFASSAVAIVLCFLANLAVAKGSLLLRVTSFSVTWFFIHALDYTLSYGFLMLTESSQSSLAASMIIGVGVNRILFVSATHLVQFIAVFIMRKIYPNLRQLERKYLFLLFAVSFGAYLMMSVFAGLIVNDAAATIQLAVIFSVFFLVLSLVVTLFAVSVKTKYEKEKRETELMAMTNSMLKKNFSQMSNSHNAVRQQVHDFKNHLLTISGMLEKDEGARQYIEQLLEVTYRQAKYCHSGNEVIDSIINCKIAEAEHHGISFSHNISLTSELHLSSVDICAVLANQIDNAIEACAKIPDEKEKSVRVEIWLKEAFVFFKVTNTCPENPFNSKRELISRKKDPTGIHGYGIKNITKTAESYGGTMKSHYADGEFVSVAMIPNNKH